MKKYLLYGALFALMPSIVSAATFITATEITEDTLWTKSGSPYVITQSLRVNSGVTLTLEPGAIVKFKGSTTRLRMFGKLIARGLPTEKIYFTSFENDAVGGDTNGDCSADNTDIDPNNDCVEGNEDDAAFLSVHRPFGEVDLLVGSDGSEISNAVVKFLNGGFFVSQSRVSFNDVEMSYNNGVIYADRSEIDVLHASFFRNLHESVASTASVIRISFATITDTLLDDALGFYEKSRAFLNNVAIKNVARFSAVILFNDSTLEASNLSIENVPRQISVGIFNNSHAVIASSTITNASMRITDGAVALFNLSQFASSTLILKESTIDGGLGDGVSMHEKTSAHLERTTIRNFMGAGVYASKAEVDMLDSVVEHNGNGVESYGASTTVFGTSIRDNAEYGFYNRNYFDGVVVDAHTAYNYWGDKSGPFHQSTNVSGTGDEVSDHVEFAPWLEEDPLKKITCCSNVMFIPGLQASRLYMKGLTENRLWEPNTNIDIGKLLMTPEGESQNEGIYTRDILDRAFNVVDVYGGLMDFMDALVASGTIAAWKSVPYDWRFDVRDVAEAHDENNPLSMIGTVQGLADTSKTGKVTIVTHSNGGLVAKALIQKLEYMKSEEESDLVDFIDKVIMIAPPGFGTPKAVVGLLHGDGQDMALGMLAQKSTMRKFGKNMPGAYGLLPSRKYFEKVADPVVVFDDSIAPISNFIEHYGQDIDTFDELKQFMLAERDGRGQPSEGNVAVPAIANPLLLDRAEELHQILDEYAFPSHIGVTELIGWGLTTPKGIKYFKNCWQRFIESTCLDHELLTTREGDETVIYKSAENTEAAAKFYFDLNNFNKINAKTIKHRNITEATSTQEFIKNILKGSSTATAFITDTKPSVVSISDEFRLRVLSPVSVIVTDELGRTVEKVQYNDMYYVNEDIPNSYYFESGEGKYVGIPLATSTVILKGLDFGTFSLDIDEMRGDTIISTKRFQDIPVSTTTIAHFEVGMAASTTLSVDYNGDGIVEVDIGGNISHVERLILLRFYIQSLTIEAKTKEQAVKRISNLIKILNLGPSGADREMYEKRIELIYEYIRKNDLGNVINVINNL
jgi:hypothetical protein